MTVAVDLEWYEVLNAAMIGVRRQVTALAAGKHDKGYIRDPWGAHINGAIGEAAVAKLTGLYWDGYVGPNGKGHGDVGPYEVRWVPAHDWDLVVRPGDDEERIYILVTGEGRALRLAGWMTGREAMAVGVFEARGVGTNKAWWVNPAHLHPIDTLPEAPR